MSVIIQPEKFFSVFLVDTIDALYAKTGLGLVQWPRNDGGWVSVTKRTVWG